MESILLVMFSAGCGKTPEQNRDNAMPADSTQAIVWFVNEVSPQAVNLLYDKLQGELSGKIAIKLHFGEEGNKNYLSPVLIKELCQRLNATLVETNVLYGGPRGSSQSHIELARRHGFDFAPIDILDSEGNTSFNLRTRHFSKFYTGSHFQNYDGYLIFSHVKGHGMAGFGAAIKNIAMGLASKEGKRFQHAGNYPVYDGEKCNSCSLCVRSCPERAITIKPVNIDHTKCIACGKCISVCPQKVFSRAPGGRGGDAFQERLVEYAFAFGKQRKMVYINVLANISPDCDCASNADKPFVKDIGILASTDLVAIETASYDLVNKACNSKDAFLEESGVSGRHTLDYAQSLGLGTMNYRMEELKLP